MATCSSILAWRIPQTEESGRLYSPWGHRESDSTEQLTHTQGHIINMSLILGHTTWKFSGVRSSVAVELFVGH